MPPTPPPPSGKPSSSAPAAPPSGGSDPTDSLDYIKSLLAQITQLSDDQLEDLKQRILQLFDVHGTDPDDTGDAPDPTKTGTMSILASAAQQLKNEVLRRSRYASNRSALSEFADSAGGGGGGAGTSSAQLTARDIPAGHRPQRHRSLGGASAVTASGNPVHDMAGIAEEFATAIRQQRSATSRDGRSHIVSVKTALGADRTLPGDDPSTVTAALDAAAEEHSARVSDVLNALRTGNALTAAGGLGAPEQVDYVLPGFSVPDRPVKGALPGFTTDRGGVRFTRAPALSDLDGAIGLWTVADDIAAATDNSKRKPSYRVAVGPEVVVDVQAVTNSLIFGNMVARAYPEFVTEATNLAMAVQARVSEQQLLTSIGALSTHVTGATEDLGSCQVN